MKKIDTLYNELELAMQNSLVKNAQNVSTDNLSEAASLINNAMQIFEDCGMHAQSDKLLSILKKIAKTNEDKQAAKDKKARLKEILNEFNAVYDEQSADDLLEMDIEDVNSADSEIDTDFEDE